MATPSSPLEMAFPAVTQENPANSSLSNLPQPPSASLPSGEQNRVTKPTEEWSDQKASHIALTDFLRAERYRLANHDRRFKISDQLYVAWRAKKTWEGTRMPRASVPVFLVLEQIESLLPQFIDGLLGDPDFFQAFPMAGTTSDQARAVAMLLRSQLRDISGDNIFESAREVLRLVKKSDLIYGNGIMEWGWTMNETETLRYERQAVPRMVPARHPMTLQPMLIPSGEVDFKIISQIDKKQISKPKAQFTDIRDFYIDPNCSSPNIQRAGFCATRHLLTINEVKQWCGGDLAQKLGFTLPEDDKLFQLAKYKSASEGDNDKMHAEAYRGFSYQPFIDQSVDPNLARVEVIRYWQKNRHVWLLGRKWCAYNKPNEYGLLPFLNSSCVDVLGRFYSISFADLLEGDQKLISDILEARVDELNLMVHSPLVRKRGSQIPSSMRRLRPGVEWEVEGDPKTDIVRMDMGNVTQQAFIEVDAAERRSQKTTGITDLVALGAPSGGNSANRTATGIKTQQQATGGRIKYQVTNFEDQFLQPFLYVLHGLNKRYLRPDQAIEIVGELGQMIQLDPLAVLNADVHFQMLGSTKMKARDALAGGGMQVILEGLCNPQFVQQMQQFGFKINIQEVVNMVTDQLGMPYRSLYLQMSPQEIQQMQQPQGPELIKLLMAQMRGQTEMQRSDDGNETKLLTALVNKIVTPDAAHEALGLPAPAAIQAKHNPPQPAGKK